jgi:hypothetical protein
MKTVITAIAVLMLLIATSTMAAQSATVSYTDSYNWHGFKLFGDEYIHPGVATSVNGIDVEAISHIGNAHDDIEYWDTSVGYTLPSLAEAGLVIKAEYGYLIMPGTDAQEFGLTAQLEGTIAPRYTIAYVELDSGDSGQFHVMGADVALGEPNALTAVLSADVTYNDGVFGITDWTHATAGIVLDVPIGPSLAIQPGCWYQYSFEPEALQCDESEIWYGIGLIAKF